MRTNVPIYLYGITNDLPFKLLLPKVRAALDAGITKLQYRRKGLTLSEHIAELDVLTPILDMYPTQFIVNDSIELAYLYGAGVHLGQSDGSVIQARAMLGVDKSIGVTCHDNLAFADIAVKQGADYVAFGAVYPSPTKPNAKQLSGAVLRQAVSLYGDKVCVIGGLTLNNVQPLLALGIRSYAVVSDVFDVPVAEVASKVAKWQKLR